jgi:hypothetical protein
VSTALFEAERVVLGYMEAFRCGDVSAATGCYTAAYVVSSGTGTDLVPAGTVEQRIVGLRENTLGRGLSLEVSNVLSAELSPSVAAVSCELQWRGPREDRRQEVTYLLTSDLGWRICAVLPGRIQTTATVAA